MLAGASLWSSAVSVWMLVGMAVEGIYVVFFMVDVFVGDFFGAGVEELFVLIFMGSFVVRAIREFWRGAWSRSIWSS